MVGPGENNFKIKAVRWLEYAIWKLDFAITVLHKRAMLLVFEGDSQKVCHLMTLRKKN